MAVSVLDKLVWSDEEVALLLGVTPDGVKNLHRVGLLKAVKIGRRLKWRPNDVRAFVKELAAGSGRD